MSELHIGLIGLGILGVLGVVAYNLWLAHRHRKLAGRLLNPSEKDVLLDRDGEAPEGALSEEATTDEDAPFVEPRIGMDAAPADDAETPEDPDSEDSEYGILITPDGSPRRNPMSTSFTDARIEPVLNVGDTTSDEADAAPLPELREVLGASGTSEASAASGMSDVSNAPDAEPAMQEHEPSSPEVRVSEPMHLLSPAVDYIAALGVAQGLSAAEWMAARQQALSRLSKRVHWAGLDEENGEWVLFPATLADASSDGDARRYRHVRAGLQLADRQGALSESDLRVFIMAMDDLARERRAMLDLPDPQKALAVAADLDAFCASVDIQISINVVAVNEVFPGTKVRALAEAAGMFIDANGRFVRADDDGNVLYVMLNHDPAGFSAETMRSTSVHGLTFLLDVPTVARGERVFAQIVDLAKRFAEVLKGAMVDDNRRPLSEASLEPIRRQVAQYQLALAERNLPAGGRMARRLFS